MFESYWRGAMEEITEDRLELESSPNSFPFQSYGLLKIMFCIHLNGTCKLYRSLKAFNIPCQNDPFLEYSNCHNYSTVKPPLS